ncbi:MAG: small, acid-soluble spore protein, alpha/beta type [Bacillota bacterium]|uniref:small, acid-soluble spore protein, alpha/beta type n=1 Tax=unclassified Candidatus Desulforudis TaxID=2635950 RepID=UPI003477353F
MPRNTNQPVKAGAAQALDQMKYEVAAELGLGNYAQMNKGDLPSRVNGYVGGNMTKKLVAFAEQALAQGNIGAITNAAPLERPQQS